MAIIKVQKGTKDILPDEMPLWHFMEEKAKDLAGRFVKNFGKYTTNEAGKALVAAGPCLEVAAPEAAACDAKADKGCCICNWFKKLFCK